MSADFLARLGDASAVIQKFSYPLLTLDRKKLPVLFASCVFLRVDKTVYLVTAAHALRRHYADLWSRGPDKLFQISGRGTASRANPIDHFDVAAVRMDDDIVQDQCIEVVPWTNLASAVEVSNPHSRAICGFPASKNKQVDSLDRTTKTFTGECLTYFGFAEYQGDFLPFGKSPTLHIGLDYVPGEDSQGRLLSSPPSPRGVSGGGAWLVPDLNQPKLVFLEGIFIECYPIGKPRYAFSTRLNHVCDFISQTHNNSRR